MNDARFAIVQRSLDVPEVEKLKRALSVVWYVPGDELL